MHSLTNWFIRNPVAANLIMLLILVAGFLTVMNIRIEGFPKLPANSITISTSFANAYTNQVDEQITQKIEKAIEGTNGVKKVTSVSVSGASTVTVEKTSGHSLQKLLDDIRLKVESVDLPKSAEDPTIYRNDFDMPAMYILLSGKSDTRTMQRLTRDLKAALLEQPEISKLRLLGEELPEITIDTNPAVLEKYNLTLADISNRVKESSLLYESGLLKTKGGNISLRADSQSYYKHDFEAIPIIENADGTRVLLGEIATVKDGFEEHDAIVRYNLENATGMEVLIGRKENLLEIADVVKKTIANFEKQIPEEISISVMGDSSSYIADRLNLLKENAFQGLALVVFLLALFLNVKLALWVGMGIPISIAGSFAVMGTKWVDYSLNDITTFGLIIALGILVDDAVVVGESVFSERKKHKDPIIGTEKGVHKVATATVFGVLTTVAAFFPMMLINNDLGKILGTFSGVVILALLFSLFESKFILPAHLAYVDIDDDGKNSKFRILRYWSVIQAGAQKGLHWFIHNVYSPSVEWAIKQRYAVFLAFIAVAVLGLGLIAKGKVKTVFFPEVPGQLISVEMEMDSRAPYNLTVANINKIESIAHQLNKDYVAQGLVDTLPMKSFLNFVEGSHKAELYVELTDSKQRTKLDTLQIVKDWQNKVGELEGTTSLNFSGSESMAGGFQVEIFSKDNQALKLASKEAMDFLANIEGLHNLRDSLKGGQPEIHFTLKPEAQHLGFTAENLAMQVSGRFGGLEIQRVQRESKEVKVFIKNSKNYRKSLDDLMLTRLKSNNGDWIPLISIANVTSSYSTEYIASINSKRLSTIRAFVDKNITSSGEVGESILQDLKPVLEKKYPNVEIKLGGEFEEMGKIKGGLIKALILTCLLIYVLMAIPLKSYLQPFIIMSIVPFGFIGATIGHLIMDKPLSLLSFFGMLALTGIVVNDSLVMITRYNDAKAEGDSTASSLHSAGVGRFQAIFLTTVTTVMGLTPLMMETSEQAQYLIPAAISLAFGEIFATLITLILIPVIIAIVEDIREYLGFSK